eukprot:4061193-Amphidinium_carterae.1
MLESIPTSADRAQRTKDGRLQVKPSGCSSAPATANGMESGDCCGVFSLEPTWLGMDTLSFTHCFHSGRVTAQKSEGANLKDNVIECAREDNAENRVACTKTYR